MPSEAQRPSAEQGPSAVPDPAETRSGAAGGTTSEPAPPASSDSGEATSADWATRCANCGASLHGRYCHACGEKVVAPEDYALAGFLRRALATLTHLDGSVFRTYYYLLAKPGFLTAEHRAGRRKRYLKPLQVFIIVNVVFYFVSAWVGLTALQTPLNTHMNASNFLHDEIATRLVEAHLSESGMALEEYAALFDRRAVQLSKTLVIAVIPLFACLLMASHALRRRYYVEHLVFALHFWAFQLLLLLAVGPLAIGALKLLHAVGLPAASLPSIDTMATAGAGIATTIYLYVAFRRRYAQAAWLCALKSGVLGFGTLYVVVFFYRPLLFFVAFLLTT